VNDVRRDRVEIAAPAKLNLGLEVISRRNDGFHDIATLFLTVDLYDHLTLTRHADLLLHCDNPNLDCDSNLALRALHVLRACAGSSAGAHLDLMKGIPAAAGLGGGSSDAAAALLAANELWRLGVPTRSLEAIAARLGSDVPFFLRGGCALGRGRGEILSALPLPEGSAFVLAVPDVVIPRKTARLYAQLETADFSDGSRVAAQAERIAAGSALDPDLLGNSFARPLYALCPELTGLPDAMRQAGARWIDVSGAGPAHYAVIADPEEAARIARQLRERLSATTDVFVARPVPARCEVGERL
jgi:4-diphosphocytidyl-2-C-methyl-D-erythritol kinase